MRRKIEERTNEMTDRNSIATIKQAIKRLLEEISLMDIRIAVIDQVILRNQGAMKQTMGDGLLLEQDEMLQAST